VEKDLFKQRFGVFAIPVPVKFQGAESEVAIGGVQSRHLEVEGRWIQCCYPKVVTSGILGRNGSGGSEADQPG
jgi:hypothetical protein